jgi:pyruvate/2-oxoglutarate dehydrogenase complex dihydrolipoamide acyltransferase (E2) component
MSEFEFRLPDVGEGLADAGIVRWLVAESETVSEMQPMVEVETAKSVVEIPSPMSGVLLRHGAAEGENLEVGDILAVIEVVSEAEEAPRAPENGLPAHPDASAVPAVQETSHLASRRTPAAPTVRRRATQLGIALDQVTGTGPGGRVLQSDLDRFESARVEGVRTTPTSVAAATDRVEKLSRMRSAIAESLSTAWAQVPLITDLRDVDAVGLVAARASLADEAEGLKIGYTAFFSSAVIAALRRFPDLNASLDATAGTVTYHGAINLGIAVSVPNGLSVAVVKDAGSLSLRELGATIDALAETARAGRLSESESTGATFTVSSFGKFGGWYGTPLVVPPQAAIAGFGPIKDRVVPWDGVPAIRATLAMSVSADHRLIDGELLSQFCSFVERMIGDPVRLLGS